MSFADWLEGHMLNCPFKELTGMDCPGCGMQRSAVHLFRGDLGQSFMLYPALLPILFTFLFLFLHLKFKFEKGAQVLQYMYISSMGIVLTSFLVKQVLLHTHS